MAINILYISSFGSLNGGGQISLWNLLFRLDRSKFNPVLVCPQEGELTLKSRQIGIPVETIPFSPFRLWNTRILFKSFSAIAKVIKKHKIHIVHADDLRQVLYMGVLKHFLGFKLIWHIRVSWRNVLLDPFGFFASDRLICTAMIITDKFKHFPGHYDKVVKVYNAVDYSFFVPEAPDTALKAKYNINNNYFVIGVVSRIHPLKGIHLLIEAFADIQKHHINTKLVIVGDGPARYREKLEKKLCKLGIKNSVFFAGFNNDVRPFLNLFDLFVLPTLEKEGCNRSILEAMACELPVLTTDKGGNKELVQNGVTGIIIPRADPSIITKETISLLSDRECLFRMGQEARKRVIANFDIAENILKTEKVYSSLFGHTKALCR